MLHSKKYSLTAIVITVFILLGCVSEPVKVNSLKPKNDVELLTYKTKITNGSRLTFAGGIIKVIDHCVYLDTGANNIPIIFPDEFRWDRGFITNGKLKLKNEQDVRINGHMITVDNSTLSSLGISDNYCLSSIKRAWLYSN